MSGSKNDVDAPSFFNFLEFLAHVLNSPPTLAVVRQLTGGTASPHLNVGDVKAFAFLLPPLAEQHEIVRRAEALFALADKIESRITAATARADKLIQATLAKAFRGELVPTEHALAEAVGHEYENAAELRQRIEGQHEINLSPAKRRANALSQRAE